MRSAASTGRSSTRCGRDIAPKRDAYNDKDKLVRKEEVFQLNDLQFAMMGSTDLTSDYDVSFDHDVEKPWVGTTR